MILPDDQPGTSSKNKRSKTRRHKTLGHGDHWAALGLGGEELMVFLQKIAPLSGRAGSFARPWPGRSFAELVQLELPRASLLFASIAGREHPDRNFAMLSAFPVLTHTAEWLVRADGILDSYGAFEGVVKGQAASGHGLQWFAPRFGFEVDQWRKTGLMRVAFAALALEVRPYAAAPIIISEGPRVEERREELRREGRFKEAADPNLSVEFIMTELRTFFSASADHHEFIGKVIKAQPIRPTPEFHGWRIDLECLPDRPPTGCSLPLHVFPPALPPGYVPKRGDLLHGHAWLQGSWKSAASSGDMAAWENAGGEVCASH